MTLEPNYVVLLALGADANDPDPAFTDVSSDLLSVQVDRGSPSDLDRNNPGTCTFVLDNYSGDYDNENADSPYVGNLVPMTQVLVYAEYDGELYPRFRGFLDDVQLDYPGEGMATATFTATDGFKPLAQTTLPSSAYAVEVLADGPVAWWRLDEPADTVAAYEAVGLNDGTPVGAPSFGVDTLLIKDPGAAMTVAGSASTGQGFNVDGPVTGSGAFSIEFWLRCGNHSGWTGRAFLQFLPGYLTSYIDIGVRDSAGASPGLIDFRTALATFRLSTVRVDDNEKHHVVCVREAGGAHKVYVDGVDRTDSGVGADGSPSLPAATANVGHSAGSGGLSGTLDEFAVYDYALSAARVAAHNDAGRTPWDGDTPAARAGRVCDAGGWPAGMRDFDTGASTLQSADLDMEALEHLQKVAESEFGGLFCALDGTLTLRERATLINRPPLATFGDADGEIGYRSITFDSSDGLIRNPVTISRAEGAAQTVQDGTGVARYYRHQYTLDGLYHDDDGLSRYAAQFFVSEYKDPKRRITGLDFGPAEVERIDDWYPLLLTAELGDVYEVVFRPPNVATPFEQRSVLEGTSETWTPAAGHAVSWFLSPAFTGDFLELDAGSDNDGLDSARLFF